MPPIQPNHSVNSPGAVSRAKNNGVIVAIGGSTGGTRALEYLLDQLPPGLPAAVFVSLHMPAGFTAQLARRLNNRSQLEVREAVNGDPVVEGTVFIAPGDYHLTAQQRSIVLNAGPKVHHVRPAVDVMLYSLADSNYRVIAVILTGMGKDGVAGVKRLKERKPGSIIIVQDPDTAVMPGMPEAVISGGCYDEIVPLSELATRILGDARSLAANNSQ